jgi:murein DD-endopeptidase MepM/ murein hydrolase activator NlpD
MPVTMAMQWSGGYIYLNRKRRKPRKYRYLAIIITLIVGISWMFLGKDVNRNVVSPVHDAETGKEYASVLEPQKDSPATVNRVSLTVKRGDTFSNILKENGISTRQALDIQEAVKEIFDLSKITAGNELALVFSHDNQTLQSIEYEIADYSRLLVNIQGENIEAQKRQIDRIVKPKSLSTNGVWQVDLSVRRGDNIFNLLQSCGICITQIQSLSKSIKGEYNLSDITPGHPLKVWITHDSPAKLTKLTYDIDPVTYLEVTPMDGIFKARTHTRIMDVLFERAEGTVTDSLYESAVRSGLSPEIVMDLTDIFGWDINFFTEIQEGDTYTVLYEKYYVDNKFKGYGRIVAARFMNHGDEHLATYFENGKNIHGYYDEHGKPIRKLFLKAPLNYRRISSGFSYHRIHPIFHVQRPHLGVDYAAPSGTPVVALGEGRIISCGWVRGFGQSVRIKHPGGYVTYYGHLSRFAKGITTGKYVSQGDVIGYVGMTGIATGPHLDFRVSYRGGFTNPLRLEPVNGPPLHGSALAKFKQTSLKLLTMLNDINLDRSLKLSKSE